VSWWLSMGDACFGSKAVLMCAPPCLSRLFQTVEIQCAWLLTTPYPASSSAVKRPKHYTWLEVISNKTWESWNYLWQQIFWKFKVDLNNLATICFKCWTQIHLSIKSEFNIVLQAPKFYGSSMEDLLWKFYWNSTKLLRWKLDNVQDLCCMQKVEALVCSSSMAWKFWSSWKNLTMKKEI